MSWRAFYPAHRVLAFSAAVRFSRIFVYATCRLLAKKIKVTRKPWGYCFLSALPCSSFRQLSPFPSAVPPRSPCSPGRGASRWSCDISGAALGSTGTSDLPALGRASPPQMGDALSPIPLPCCFPVARSPPSPVLRGYGPGVWMSRPLAVISQSQGTGDAHARASNPSWPPALPGQHWCHTSRDFPRKDTQYDLSPLK